MNSVGFLALVIFFLAWIGAALSFFILNIWTIGKATSQQPFLVWTDSRMRWKFLVFLGFCVLGVLSGALGFFVGEWPRN